MSDNLDRVTGKLGRLPAQRPTGLHMLSYYLTSPLPAGPTSVSVPNITWNMYDNDSKGDCTWAGFLHSCMSTASVLNISQTWPNPGDTANAYLAYNGGQDQGCVESSLLTFAVTSGLTIAGVNYKLAAAAPTDKADFQELQSVIANTGSAYIGVNLPTPAMDQFRQNQPWDLTGTPADQNIEGGHCVVIVGYDSNYYYIITWGRVQAVTLRWLQSYMEESWAILTPEVVTAGSFNNLSLATLQTDFQNL